MGGGNDRAELKDEFEGADSREQVPADKLRHA